jgi:phosphoglycerate dehydrogenase-like enzyme
VDLAEHSDVLFVALAASAATRHIVDRRDRGAGAEGMLVNISRAANVDEAALIARWRPGAGVAALDVFEGEPP